MPELPAVGCGEVMMQEKRRSPISDDLASLGVNDLQCVPNDTNTMYLATGDYDGNSIPSIGLLKSY